MVTTDTSSSLTFDCYFARFFNGLQPLLITEIMLVGATGSE